MELVGRPKESNNSKFRGFVVSLCPDFCQFGILTFAHISTTFAATHGTTRTSTATATIEFHMNSIEFHAVVELHAALDAMNSSL